MSAVADAIVVVDTAGIVRYGNPAAQELFGRSRAELVGVELGFPVAPGEPSDIDLLLPDGGSRVVEMRVTETTWEAEPVYVAALRDIGARWHVERELKAAVEHRDTVLAVAAHEMRTPLAVILGMAEILRDGWAGLSEDRRLHLVDLIDKQAHHLRQLVRKLLTLSRIEAGVLGAEPVAFDTSELVLSRLPELADRSRDVRVSCAPGLVAYADADHLWQILANYLENAFKYGAPPVELSVVEQGRVGRVAGVRLRPGCARRVRAPPVRALQPRSRSAAAGRGGRPRPLDRAQPRRSQRGRDLVRAPPARRRLLRRAGAERPRDR